MRPFFHFELESRPFGFQTRFGILGLMKQGTKPSSSVAANKKAPKRRFRLWEKKRGDRQTGSPWWGSAGEVMFFASLFLVGVLALTQLITLRLFAEEEFFLTSNWVMALVGLVLGSLIVIGATGAVYGALLASTSAERRAAIAQRATSRDLLADLRSKSEEFPAIPNDMNWKISPGVRLAYRLPSSSTTAFRTASLAVFTLTWNAAVLVLAVLVTRGSNLIFREWLSRPGVNLSGVVLTVFTVMGAYLIYLLIRQLVAAEAMGADTRRSLDAAICAMRNLPCCGGTAWTSRNCLARALACL